MVPKKPVLLPSLLPFYFPLFPLPVKRFSIQLIKKTCGKSGALFIFTHKFGFDYTNGCNLIKVAVQPKEKLTFF